ncbi:MAG: hypothetical protein ABIV43_02685, partial [Candidatus Saccharimonadales bacterium]
MSPEIESRTDWRRLVVALTAGSVVVSAVSMVASSNPGNQAVVESIPSVEPTAVTPWRVPIGISPSPITLPSKLHRKADLLPNPTQLPVILRTDVASQPHKSVTYSQASTKLAKWVERAPGIMELAKHFPDKPIRDPKSQLRRISLLDAATPVTALDLANFQVNTRYQHAFDDQIGGARIVMRGLVAHMSVDHFAGGVTEYISFMRLHHR